MALAENVYKDYLSLIKQIPPNEITYYIVELISSLQQTERQMSADFLEQLRCFIRSVASNDYIDMANSYQQLMHLSNINNKNINIGYQLINIGAAICGTIIAILGGLIGGVAGFFRNLAEFSNPISGLGVGLTTGILVGSAIGFRSPKALFKDSFTRRLKFCLDKIDRCIEDALQCKTIINELVEDAKADLTANYFDGDGDAFKEFYSKTEIKYDVSSFHAQFISPQLEGFLGHHAFIQLPINKKNYLIEFTNDPADLNRPRSRTEERTASGEKIVDMIAMHRLLQKRHVITNNYLLTKMKSADDNDCVSYVNKVLVGTHQKSTAVSSFYPPEDNWVGRNIVGFFIKKASPFPPDFLDTVSEDVAAVPACA